MSIFERLKKVILSELPEIREDQVVMDANFRKDLNVDSMELFDLILALEDEFGLAVSDEDAMQILTVGDAVRYLQKELGEE